MKKLSSAALSGLLLAISGILATGALASGRPLPENCNNVAFDEAMRALSNGCVDPLLMNARPAYRHADGSRSYTFTFMCFRTGETERVAVKLDRDCKAIND